MLYVVIRSSVVREDRNAHDQEANNQAKTLCHLPTHETPLRAVPRKPFSRREEKSSSIPTFQTPPPLIYQLPGHLECLVRQAVLRVKKKWVVARVVRWNRAGRLPSEAVRYMLPFGLYNNTRSPVHAAGVGRMRVGRNSIF